MGLQACHQSTHVPCHRGALACGERLHVAASTVARCRRRPHRECEAGCEPAVPRATRGRTKTHICRDARAVRLPGYGLTWEFLAEYRVVLAKGW